MGNCQLTTGNCGSLKLMKLPAGSECKCRALPSLAGPGACLGLTPLSPAPWAWAGWVRMVWHWPGKVPSLAGVGGRKKLPLQSLACSTEQPRIEEPSPALRLISPSTPGTCSGLVHALQPAGQPSGHVGNFQLASVNCRPFKLIKLPASSRVQGFAKPG